MEKTVERSRAVGAGAREGVVDRERPAIAVERVACCVCGGEDSDVVGRGIDFEYETCANEFSYVRCVSCGHHYVQPRPAASELGVIYPERYGNYSNSVDPGLAFRVKAWLEGRSLARLCGELPADASVLDIGCGDGRLLAGVRRVLERRLQIHGQDARATVLLEGIEISDRAAAGARARGIEVRVGSIDALELGSRRYDLVSLIQVIEHVLDPVGCIEKVHGALKPGGRVWFETPSRRCIDFALFKRRYWGGYHFPRHFNLFEPDNFTRLLESRGFRVESVRHKLQPVHWVWTCHHYFKEQGWPAWWTERFHIRNPFYLAVFSLVDAVQLVFWQRSSNMQIIARKPEDAA